MKSLFKKRIYMDYAAAAPILPQALKAQVSASKPFGNPSSIHKDGVLASRLLEGARIEVSQNISAHKSEITFVGSGTESDNLAIFGVFKYAKLQSSFLNKQPHIITTTIEHSAVLEACKHLEKVGARVTYLPVGVTGLIDLKELRAAICDETILISIAYVNNEIGTVQPIREIAKEVRHFKKNASIENCYPLFHTDACQAAGYFDLNVEKLGVDLLTWNSSKIGGPRGVGALYIRRGTPILPIMYGGGQEGGLRSGTENIPGIIGFSEAFKIKKCNLEKEKTHTEYLQNYFFDQIKAKFPEIRINGDLGKRSPNNVHISIPGISSELLVIELDACGISCSAGSACDSAKDKSSHVTSALYGSEDEKAMGSIRFSYGSDTTKKEIDFVISALKKIINKYSHWKKS